VLDKKPQVLRKKAPGFVADRLQSAIFRECVCLVAQATSGTWKSRSCGVIQAVSADSHGVDGDLRDDQPGGRSAELVQNTSRPVAGRCASSDPAPPRPHTVPRERCVDCLASAAALRDRWRSARAVRGG
jgi:hypothetical protein